MALVPVALPDCFGIDTNQRFTEEQYQKLWTTDLRTYSWAARKASPQSPVFPDFIGRYGPLYGNGVGTDLTADELVIATQTGAAAGRKGIVLMFQHVRRGAKDDSGTDIGWIPTAAMGLEDAQTIVGYADSIGYSVTYASGTVPGLVPHIVQDLENVRAGYSSLEMAQAWHDFVLQAQRVAPSAYNGFNPGLTPAQFLALGVPLAKDIGPRHCDCGYAYEQTEYVTIPGLGQVDIAHAHPDARDASLVGMAYLADAA